MKRKSKPTNQEIRIDTIRLFERVHGKRLVHLAEQHIFDAIDKTAGEESWDVLLQKLDGRAKDGRSHAIARDLLMVLVWRVNEVRGGVTRPSEKF